MKERMTLESLECIVMSLSEPKDIKRDENSVTFKYRDKDGDEVPCLVNLLNEERISAAVLLPIPDSHRVTAMIVSNMYNNKQDAHGTFAYTTKIGDDKWCIVLETHISTRGGVEEEAIRYQIRRLIDQINNFEEMMIDAIQEVGPDTSFLKGGVWQALGSFFGSFLREYYT